MTKPTPHLLCRRAKKTPKHCFGLNKLWCDVVLLWFSYLQGMFRGARNFNRDLPWDMSNAIATFQMFEGAVQFNGDISTWRLGKARQLYRMFFNAESFNGDLSQWQTDSFVNLAVSISLTTQTPPPKSNLNPQTLDHHD